MVESRHLPMFEALVMRIIGSSSLELRRGFSSPAEFRETTCVDRAFFMDPGETNRASVDHVGNTGSRVKIWTDLLTDLFLRKWTKDLARSDKPRTLLSV